MARRWNGWGDDSISHAPSDRTLAFLASRIGATTPLRSATREDALAAVPASRLPPGTHYDTSAASRLDHAFGQGTPDWIDMRSGRGAACADGVACPADAAGVQAALDEALRLGAAVLPYGGGTSVVGHLRAVAADRPCVHLSLERLCGLQDLDARDLTARFGAGTPGPAIEAALAAHGLTLGHFPQSFEYSTAGGWVATRSSGQQSLRYGRIERLFHGGRLATPRGAWTVGGLPASSAGPDLREAVLGSEGRLGLLTEVTLRVRPRAAHEAFHACFFGGWEAGLAAVQELAQTGSGLSMLRYASAAETETQLALVEGHDAALAWLRRWLRWRGIELGPAAGTGGGACLLLAGVTGSAAEVRAGRSALREAVARQRGVAVGTALGAAWQRHRFRAPYLRNTLWDAGVAVETVETCVPWSRASATLAAVEGAGREALAAQGERVHAYTHLSHVYAQGCSVYTTFVFRLPADPVAQLDRWRALKTATARAVLAQGGTISHQHGVGLDHAPWLAPEKGEIGMGVLRALAHELDPQGLMNPGKLLS